MTVCMGMLAACRFTLTRNPCLLQVGPPVRSHSSITKLSFQPVMLLKNNGVPLIFSRSMSAKRIFVIHPSRFAWRRFKSSLHFFVMLGVIPLGAISIYANVFIGEAELAEIPEGYYPKEYEYYKHPITRWFQRNITETPQKGYEQMLYSIDETVQKMKMRRLLSKVQALQAERMDYQGYQHLPVGHSSLLYTEQWHDRAATIHEETANAFRPLK